MLSAKSKGFLFVFCAVLLWSTAEVVTRTIHDDIAPIQLSWIRFIIGGVFLALFLPHDLSRKKIQLNRRIIFHSAWLAIFGIVFSGIAFQYALIYAGAGVVATVFGATPIMVFVLSRIILGDPMTFGRLSGVVLGFIGILILAASKDSPTFSFLGFGLSIFNVFCFSLFTVFVKKLAGPYAGIPLSVLTFLIGALMMTPLVFWEADWRSLEHLPELWLPVLYLSVGTSGLAYLFYFSGLERVDATQAVSVILLKPPIATALAAVFLGEAITWNLVLAMVFILTGLYAVNWFRQYGVEARQDTTSSGILPVPQEERL